MVGSAIQGLFPKVEAQTYETSEMRGRVDALDDIDAAAALAASSLAARVRRHYNEAKWNRVKHNLNLRLLAALRTYNGEYDAQKLQEIQRFGGSDLYARLTTAKCRGATAMLRDVFLTTDRVWELLPTPIPSIPDQIGQGISELVTAEAVYMAREGQPVDDQKLRDRSEQLAQAAAAAAGKQAKKQAKLSENKLDDILVEGGFYEALHEFLVDLPIFPIAILKGPEVVNQWQVKWVEGAAKAVKVPMMTWRRVSPFDFFICPASSNINDSWVIERIKLTRADLNELLGLPGYDDDAIRAVLEEYNRGYHDWLDETDAERAEEENKENPTLNDGEIIDSLEFHGPVQGQDLLDFGYTEEQVPDADVDYFVVAWVIGRHTIKIQINPNPKKRNPYYTGSYDPVPGSPYGNSLTELISDIQDVANASLRSLVNNLSIASGPQVIINEERLSPTTDGNSLYPWKRWRVISDPSGMDNTPPISFFQPQSNTAELLGVYNQMQVLADEISAIPRYMTGSQNTGGGGGGKTASGLAMLMNNASKVLQNIAADIDKRILEPVLKDLYDMVLLTDNTGMVKGDESIAVRGATKAMQKETDRMRKLEFMQMTGNPMDYQIVGVNGRAAILRSLAEDLGLPHEAIVPSEAELNAIQQQQAQQQQQQTMNEAAAAAAGSKAPQGKTGGLSQETDNMHRTRTQ